MCRSPSCEHGSFSARKQNLYPNYRQSSVNCSKFSKETKRWCPCTCPGLLWRRPLCQSDDAAIEVQAASASRRAGFAQRKVVPQPPVEPLSLETLVCTERHGGKGPLQPLLRICPLFPHHRRDKERLCPLLAWRLLCGAF